MTTFFTGTSLILWLQQFSPTLDLPFRIITVLGDELFFLLFLPLVYWCLHRRIGAGLAVLFLFSASLNAIAKVLLGMPRPFMVEPAVMQLTAAGGGGFPSGHTQGAVVVWIFLAARFKARWLRWLAGILIIAIPLSRLYLGVHFPVDLVGGYLIGGLLVMVFLKIEPPIIERIGKPSKAMAMAGALAIVLSAALLKNSQEPYVVSSVAALMGVSLGIVVERRWIGFEIRSGWLPRFGCLLIGMIGLAAIYIGLKAGFEGMAPTGLMRLIRYCMVGLWTTAGAPLFFERLIKTTKPIQ